MVQETSYGVLRPPLGSVRLTIIELVAVLLRTGSEEADTAIIASGIVRDILDVFLHFPFNSILHHQVWDVCRTLALNQYAPPTML
jgi:serine/threonine-protein phosphatase 6 regulatory subunit 3